jgi:tRNA U34 2-thiouridine synthase MnmA/TrmU
VRFIINIITSIKFCLGHYARKSWSEGRPKLLTAKDDLKDQSFYLSSISEEGLARALFPLGSLTKVEVRELARRYNLETAERPESMGLCFVGEKGKFSNFLCMSTVFCLPSQPHAFLKSFLPSPKSRRYNKLDHWKKDW